MADPTDAQIRELARGVLTGYISGTRGIESDAEVVRGAVGGRWVPCWLHIPDLALAMRQYRDHHGHGPGETREGGEG